MVQWANGLSGSVASAASWQFGEGDGDKGDDTSLVAFLDLSEKAVEDGSKSWKHCLAGEDEVGAV